MSTETTRAIGKISSYYGDGLKVRTEGARHFWMIDDPAAEVWEEIPRDLFDALNRFEDARREPEAAAKIAELEAAAAALGMKLVKA
jgi:hypothetical protein